MAHLRAGRAASRGPRSTGPARSRPGAQTLGRPGDLLITPDGTVLAVRHGRHADDQWSVDDLLALAPTPATPERGR